MEEDGAILAPMDGDIPLKWRGYSRALRESEAGGDKRLDGRGGENDQIEGCEGGRKKVGKFNREIRLLWIDAVRK